VGGRHWRLLPACGCSRGQPEYNHQTRTTQAAAASDRAAEQAAELARLRVALESERSKGALLEGHLAEAQLVAEKRLLSAQRVRGVAAAAGVCCLGVWMEEGPEGARSVLFCSRSFAPVLKLHATEPNPIKPNQTTGSRSPRTLRRPAACTARSRAVRPAR